MGNMDKKNYPDSLWAVCAEKTLIRRFQKGAIVVTRGDQSDAVYLVRKGELKICVSDGEGKEAILNVIGPGESFGELAVFTGESRSADVIANESCEMMILSRDVYLQALEADSKLAVAALKYLSHRVLELSEQVSSLALEDVFGRISKLLKDSAKETDEGKVIDGLTHQDIAAAVGASREMVSKILGDLKRGGYIDTKRKKITLLKRLPKGW